MASDEIGVVISGVVGEMDARALERGLSKLLDLLGDPRAGAPEPGSVWVLSELSQGSVHVGVRPGGIVHQEVRDRIATVSTGVTALRGATGVPDGWDEPTLQELIRLGELKALQGVTAVAIKLGNEPPIDLNESGILRNARESLSERSVSLGSVQGVLDRWISRGGRREAGLRDRSTERAVTVYFSDSLRGQVLALLDTDVVVWGEIRRNGSGQKLSVRASGIESRDRGLPEPTRNIVGVLGEDWTAGLDGVEWAREQRG